jgi:hypothetical protein
MIRHPITANTGPVNNTYQPHLNFICLVKKPAIPLNGIKLKLVFTFKNAAT